MYMHVNMDGELTVIPVDEDGNQLQLSTQEISAVQSQVRHIQSQLQLDDASFTTGQTDVVVPSVSRLNAWKTDGYNEDNIDKADCSNWQNILKADGNNQQNVLKADSNNRHSILKVDSNNHHNIWKTDGNDQLETAAASTFISSDVTKSGCITGRVRSRSEVTSDHMRPVVLVCNVRDREFGGDDDGGGEKVMMVSGVRNMSPAGFFHNLSSDETEPSFHLYRCPTCYKTFTSDGTLAKHMQVHTPESFVCLECGKTFNLKGNLQKHMDTHSGKKQFKCEECGKEFLLKGNLKKHQLNHSGQKDYICLVCQKKFVLKGNLQKHLATHIKPFDCEQCSEAFSTQASLSRHIKSSHAEPSVYECHLCRKQFHYMRYLRQHMETHQESIAYTCSSCEQQFKTSALLKAHKRRAHTEPTEECETCGKKFLTKHDLKRHAEIHREDKPFQCEICRKTFVRKAALSKHLGSHKDFRCDKCSASFNTEENLHHHESVPCGDNVLACPICQQSFTRRANLKRHLRYHGGKRSFTCDICQEMFTRKESMQRHLMGHRDIKPHECNFCGKRFLSAWNLKTHRYTHTGECPYKCVHCGKGFRSTWNRNIHMTTHTGRKAYTCRVCMTQFTTYTSLRRHSASHYPHLNSQNTQLRNRKRKSTMKIVNACHSKSSGSGSKKTDGKQRKLGSRKTEFSLRPIRKPNRCSVCDKGFWSPLFLQSHIAKHREHTSSAGSQIVGRENRNYGSNIGLSESGCEASESLIKPIQSDTEGIDMQVFNKDVFSHNSSFPKPKSFVCNSTTQSNRSNQEMSNDHVMDAVSESCCVQRLTDSLLERQTGVTQENKSDLNTMVCDLESKTKQTSNLISSHKNYIPSDHSVGITSEKNLRTQEISNVTDIQYASMRLEHVSSCEPGLLKQGGNSSHLVADRSRLKKKNISFHAECYICAKEFDNKSQLKRHMKIHETGS
ncbi:zinc finger protein 665-like [Gigantopelta aegis]|uniref:zinc finger protein 665-like n=1 Tax=Gigantopelta aegis TaxID=1735272 RepID=UPI001B889121|nr:zinc finger protein 665-like [Gigantopelta aegis]